MTKALVINPGEDFATLTEVDAQDLGAMQKLVGGYLEGFPFASVGMALVNEEGKLVGLPVNQAATMLAHDVGAIPPRDTINGPMVLVSVAPGGATSDVPDSIVDYVRDMEIEVREEGVAS